MSTPDFILNIENHTIDNCKNKREEIILAILDEDDDNTATVIGGLSGEDTTPPTVPYAKLYKDSYNLNLLMFSCIMPLGLTSILMSLSSIWVDEIHELTRKMIRKFSLHQLKNHKKGNLICL